VLTDDCCIFCCRDSETTHHILWDCPSSLDVWSESGGKIQKRISEGGGLLELVENVMKSLQKEDMELFVMVAVRIWKRRNGVVHGEPFIHPCVIVKQATE
jgi:hypothetical protein